MGRELDFTMDCAGRSQHVSSVRSVRMRVRACVKASSGWKLSHHVGGKPRAWLSMLSTQAPQGGVSSHDIALVVEIGTQVSLSG